MKLNIVAYLCQQGLGSEFEVGYSATRCLTGIHKRVFVPKFQFNTFSGVERNINGWCVKRISDDCLLVKVGNRSSNPKTAYQYRFSYFLWMQSIFILFVTHRLKYKIWFVTLVQVLSPNLLMLFRSRNVIVGPMGGQAEFWRLPFLSRKLRAKNFFITRVIYKFCLLRFVSHRRTALCHPALTEIVPGQKLTSVIPAIEQIERTIEVSLIPMVDRRLVLFIGRKLELKGGLSIELLFNELACAFPQYKFEIIGPGWPDMQVRQNFETISGVSREAVTIRLSRARLHVFPSVELAGYVLFEAVREGCPNFCLSGFGGGYLVSPSERFLCAADSLDLNQLVYRMHESISSVIKCDDMLEIEAQLQYQNSLAFTSANKEQFLNFFLSEGDLCI